MTIIITINRCLYHFFPISDFSPLKSLFRVPSNQRFCCTGLIMSTTETEKKQEEDVEVAEKSEPTGGELLYFGSTAYDSMGRKGSTTGHLLSPTRLRPLLGIDIRFIASGSASCHCLAVDTQGRCYTWGRNEKGQLGQGDTLQRNLPTLVSDLSKYRISNAGSGRSHTVVVTDDGKSFAFGWNKHGQLGSGSAKNEIESSPVLCLVSQATNAICGADFTVWLSSNEGSTILTSGLPQYGQLGHGTDGEYNSKDSSVRLVYEPQPRPRAIATLTEKTIVKAACGTNHTVAVDSTGFVYTWGFGGYGRLGHRDNKDEWIPRVVEVFKRNNVLPPTAVVSAGSANSSCTAGGGQLYMWGKIKNTGEDWMYPKPVMDLSGWNIRCMDSGNLHHVVGADDSCISWGVAQYGELGYGPLGQKSSANPKKIEILDGMHVMSAACGTGFSIVVVDRGNIGDRLEQLDVYGGPASAEEGVSEDKNKDTLPKSGSRKKAAVNSPGDSKKRKKEASSESEPEDYGSEDSDPDANENGKDAKNKRGSKASGRGRGRGRPKSTETKKPTGRGRGRPKGSGKNNKKSR